MPQQLSLTQAAAVAVVVTAMAMVPTVVLVSSSLLTHHKTPLSVV
jgi:hypothetical protein